MNCTFFHKLPVKKAFHGLDKIMTGISYIDRESGQHCTEQVYGGALVNFLYGSTMTSQIIGAPLRHFVSRTPYFSWLVGCYQRSGRSRSAIQPFIEAYGLDPEEFLEKVEDFESFDAFFVRKLKPEARPVDKTVHVAVTPADGRYLAYKRASEAEPFGMKGIHMDLATLIGDKTLAERYRSGSMVLARLCPSDYHRFHFPIDCLPSQLQAIKGPLYSVNRHALIKRPASLWQNRRILTKLQSQTFGKVLCIEVGATCVGTIHQTFEANKNVSRGQEKGFFSFGGSAMVLLFPEGSLELDRDLLENSARA